MFVDADDPVKLARLTLTNTSSAPRRLSVFGYVEWRLGPPRAGEQRFVVTEVDAATRALFARNAYNEEFSGRVAFWHATEAASAHTCDRAEFIGRNRTLAWPAALTRERLEGRCGAGLDPCGALQLTVDLAAGETRRVAFVLGQAGDAEAARALAGRYASLAEVDASLARVEALLGRDARRGAGAHAG